MDHDNDSNAPTRTMVDPALAPRKLKEGMVPEGTGIFLCIEEGPGSGRLFTLSDGGVHLIGREGADIVLGDTKVSRKHAEIGLYGPGAYVLRDLASTNGTFVNGRRVSEKTKLKHWDLVRVGNTELRFEVIEESIPLSGGPPR